MALKGVKVGAGATAHAFDFDYLANKPVALPAVTVSDAGKFLRVNASGEWEAAELPSAEESEF